MHRYILHHKRNLNILSSFKSGCTTRAVQRGLWKVENLFGNMVHARLRMRLRTWPMWGVRYFLVNLESVPFRYFSKVSTIFFVFSCIMSSDCTNVCKTRNKMFNSYKWKFCIYRWVCTFMGFSQLLDNKNMFIEGPFIVNPMNHDANYWYISYGILSVMDIMWPANQSNFYVFCLYSLKWNFIYYHSYIMLAMKSMSICSD